MENSFLFYHGDYHYGMTLETERLLLRPFELDDAEEMYERWSSDPEVCKYLSWQPHTDVSVTQYVIWRWLEEYKKPDTYRFGIVYKEDGALIGSIDVVTYWDGEPVIGYCMSRPYWGRGLMTEACKELLDLLRREGFKRAHIEAVKENIGSNRVIEKCGFRYVKTEAQDFPRKNQFGLQINQYVIDL